MKASDGSVAILALPTALIGVAITPLAQLSALVAILVAGTIVDSALMSRHSAP